jgi:hypothetical protein
MALNIQTIDEINMSSVTFSKLRKNKNGGKAVYINFNNQKVYLQLPFMKAPFGLGQFTDEATKKTTYNLDLSLDPSVEGVEKFAELDELVLDTVKKNSVEWLGKDYNIAVMREALYKPLVRKSAKSDEYAPTLKLKILVDSNQNFIPEAYNTNREAVDLRSIEKGQKVLSIIDINQIWFIDNKFGVTVRLQQCLIEPSKKLPSFAFKGIDNLVTPTPTGSDVAEEEEFDDGEIDC